MDVRAKGWWLLLAVMVICFALSGGYVIYHTRIDPFTDAETRVAGLVRVLYILHLAFWMLSGMTANYLWDLFRNGKSWPDIMLRDLFIPFLISPIVFYGIYSLWGDKTPTLALCLIAFQNGFFWQVVFSKAGPISEQGTAARRAVRAGEATG